MQTTVFQRKSHSYQYPGYFATTISGKCNTRTSPSNSGGEKNVVDFIWDSKPPKIAYDVMIQGIENRGLILVDFESKVKSLKLGFIKRLLQNKTGKWRHTAAKFYKTNDLDYYFKCNRIPSNIGNKFYEETLHYWSELQEIRIATVEIIHNQTIWENRYITISNRPYKWSNWAAKGIVQIHDIIKENDDFLNHSEIKESLVCSVTFSVLDRLFPHLPQIITTIAC